MGRILKICLAMGGGVSLGSFSGAALTEALKLLILYGQDDKGNAYDEVIVDGMSGASAGAIALVIMLKTLIDYETMMKNLNGVTHDSLLKDISKRYFQGNDEKANQFKKIEDLKALEVAQKIQEAIWVNELDAKKLFGTEKITNYKPNVNESFSLLDRQLLETLAKQYLINTKTTILNKVRVPFACSLTNLLPIEIKKDETDLPKLEQNVMQSVGAQNHSELRVIDFVFNPNALKDKPTDSCWLECSNPEEDSERQFNLTKEKAWAIICTSALACGAFPIAFDPVILKRYKEEFGGDGPDSQWPIQFKKLNAQYNKLENEGRTSVFNEKTSNTITYNSFNFPYVDGGTFNNEPIKEAYRIGTFQDYGQNTDNSDRLILFVDPIVRTQKYQSFLQSALVPVKMKEKTAYGKDELAKLIGVTTSLVTTLKNQGRIKEEHKIMHMKENLELRQTIFNYLDKNEHLGDTLDFEILRTAYNKIKANLKAHIISIGTRDVISYFKNELKKTCISLNEPNSRCLFIGDSEFRALRGLVENKMYSDKFEPDGYKVLKIETPEDKNLFARTVFKIIFDFSLNTDGKNDKANRVAILPINTENNIISLPGEEISAFGGFASLKARQYAFHYGKLSTFKSLSEGQEGFRKKKENKPLFPFIALKNKAELEQAFINEINNVGFFKAENINTYQREVQNTLVKLSVKRFVVMLKGMFNVATLFQVFKNAMKGLLGRLFIKLNKFLDILSNVFFKKVKEKVVVNHIGLLPVTISVLSNSKLSLQALVATTDNELVKIKMFENQGNVANSKYQYLFQVYRALYKKERPIALASKIEAEKALIGSTYSLEAENVGKIALTLHGKVRLPDNIDGNLNQNTTKQLESGFKQIISEIKIGKHKLPSINEALNNKSNMLHYSFLNIEYHLSPLVEINMDEYNKQGKGWYFKENTQALYKKFLTP
ncbi:MAG: patatin-like phospholipase family protein [Paludibacteraceae bacterium]